ncbi:Gfo/Idh/MocA family oxidoreductase [Rossellomorea vietnamensis]|uniref:Gfo/Idh/MocA family oxidoreductase n=1 Tax=Rossellomorea vietnamensis TaxID=218284 RepID=A0A6I6UUP3_9BACI|nr:Gfo/Idh/MocA family oxidoreductase [Rossellomorea vietnamensis]QHE63371.1 Gfo/Idh/MocA family oxidoreductase [Rossellomorea vietnamensis]
MIKFGIVGCGHIAKKHINAIQEADGAILEAICDTQPERVDMFSNEYKVKGYTSLEEMLQTDVDVVNICTPSGFHADIAVQIANAKKHVIVEKPIALTLEDTDKIIHACDENNVKLAVVHPNRFRPAFVELKELVQNGVFGKISHSNATVRWNRNQEYYDQAPWRGTKSLDGGVLMNQAVHNLDLLIWLMGDVKEVYSMAATRVRDIEAEDVSTGLARFEDGSLGVIEAATTIYPKNYEESISIFGEKGTVKISGANAIHIEHLTIEGMDEAETERLIEKIKNDPWGKPGHQCIIEDMVQAINEDREPIVTGMDGRKALELVLSLYDSAEQNKPIILS